MTNTEERLDTVAAALALVEDEFKRAQVIAQAEEAFAAANGAQDNPWDGAGKNAARFERERERLLAEYATLKRKHEDQRKQHELVEYGKQLAQAISELRETNATIVRITDEYEKVAADLHTMEANPTVVRWANARALAQRYGLGHSFGEYATWFESGRDWRMGPQVALQAASDGWVAATVAAWANAGVTVATAREKTIPLRFNEEDRALVLAARLQREVVREVAERLNAARDRRAELLEQFPAIATTEPAEAQFANT
jgi:uncharacterized protein YdcH (DUF465 family)